MRKLLMIVLVLLAHGASAQDWIRYYPPTGVIAGDFSTTGDAIISGGDIDCGTASVLCIFDALSTTGPADFNSATAATGGADIGWSFDTTGDLGSADTVFRIRDNGTTSLWTLSGTGVETAAGGLVATAGGVTATAGGVTSTDGVMTCGAAGTACAFSAPSTTGPAAFTSATAASGGTDIGFTFDVTGNMGSTDLAFRIRDNATTNLLTVDGGGSINFSVGTANLNLGSSGDVTWNSDTGLIRTSAAVVGVTNGSTTTHGLLGGGAAIASAATLPAFTGNIQHVTGTTNIDNLTSTGLGTGFCTTMIFDGILTVADGGNMKLTAAMVTTGDDTLTVCWDGTSFFEIARSVN